MPKTTRFDAADYLSTEKRQVAYIAAALESGDADFVRDALGLVARARGMGGIAKKAGLVPWVSLFLRAPQRAHGRQNGDGSRERSLTTCAYGLHDRQFAHACHPWIARRANLPQ